MMEVVVVAVVTAIGLIALSACLEWRAGKNGEMSRAMRLRRRVPLHRSNIIERVK